MPRLSPDQVLALAPDASAVAGARDLARPAKWVTAKANDNAVWGEAQGSGKNPYQTAVDLRNIAYKCSCPSRKLPCKHALGLLLRHANGEILPGTPPDWVSEWLDKRDERDAKQAEKSEAPERTPDPEAAAKRADKRWRNILLGIEECQSFLEDVVGQGLLTAQSTRSWDEMAARMVDAQAPGVAARLKRIGLAIGVGPDWGRTVTLQLGSLQLLLEAARRLDSLPADVRSDVTSALGIPTRKEDLTGEPVTDVWDVLGQVVETEDRLTTCRSWLRGRGTKRWAKHLSFSVAGQPFDFRPAPGSAFHAVARYYPSAWPSRVHLEVQEMGGFVPDPGGRLEDVLNLATEAWSQNPWVSQIPCLLSGATLGREGDRWFAIDSAGQAAPMGTADPWAVLAATGNSPSELFGEWNGESMKLMAAWGTWGFVGL